MAAAQKKKFFETTLTGDVAKITLLGTIRGSDIPELQASLENELDKRTKVFFDLSKAKYLCSSAVGVLLSLSEKFKLRGGKALVVQPPPATGRIFNILGFHNMVTFVQTDDEAIASLSAE